MPVFTSIGLALGATVAASAGAGIGAFGVGVAVASLAAAGIATSVGTSMYSASQEAKQQEELLQAQEDAVTAAENKADAAKSLATQEANNKLKKQRLAQTNTILTSPLGVSDEANVGLVSLLGG